MLLRLSFLSLFLCQFLVSYSLLAQVNLTNASPAYSQDFNTLATSGTTNPWMDNSVLTGWYARHTNIVNYCAGDGFSNTGALYSFGTGTQTDRALGSLASGSTDIVYYGIRIRNNGTSAITSISVTYTLEQWRDGGGTGNTPDTISFQYKLNADSISGNASLLNWIIIDTAEFLAPTVTTTTSGQSLNGNAAANKKTFMIVIPINIPVGEDIWLRWVDRNHVGSDEGIGVDDFSVTATFDSGIKPEPTNHVTGLVISDSTTTSLTLVWTASVAGSQAPDGYFVKGSTGTVIDPTDGVTETTGIIAYVSGTTATLTGLTAGTDYNFKVFPYTNSGTNIDYKIAGAPSVSGRTKNSVAPATPQFMFTQYYEGKTGDNSKWIEVKNIGTTSFDANANPLFVAYFGNTTLSTNLSTTTPQAGRQYKFSGIIPAGDIVLLKNGVTPPNPVYAQTLGDSTPTCFFNGNDILVLTTDTTVGNAWNNRIDVLGSLGNWGVDTSFVRKASVTSPNTTFSLSEWDGYSNTDIQNAVANTNPRLGYHEFSTIKPEPTNHVTGLVISDSTTTSLTLVWTASVAGSQAPDGYFVKGSTGTVIDPTDGVTETTGIIAYVSGTTATLTGLTAGTDYNFKVFPYTNSGTNIDYKIAGAPSVSGRTKVSAPSTGLTPVPISTIRPIQPNGEPTTLGNTVILTGTFHGVNTISQTPTDLNRFQYYLIDGTGGVTVRNASNTTPPHTYKDFGTKFQEGDSVILRGKVSVFKGLTQIQSIDTVVLIASGKNRKTPILLSGMGADTLGESNESDYVELQNVSIANTSQWLGGPSYTGSGFNVNITHGASNRSVLMRINGFTELAKKTYSEVFGTATSGITIRGFANQFAGTSPPYTGGYQFMPHYQADIIIGTTPTPTNISVTSTALTYNQDFNTLPTSATNNNNFTWANDNTLAGWFAGTASGSLTARISDGSNLSSGSYGGGLYSMGQLSATERALGSLSSGTPRWVFYGARFINNTGKNIISLTITYTGEQWRNSKNDRDTLRFQYRVNATQITDTLTDWTSVGELNFITPTVGGTATGLDGNASANRNTLTHTITGLNIPNGQQIWIRWADRNEIGSDHLFGIDDLTVTFDTASPVPLAVEPTNHILNLTGIPNSQSSITLNWQLPASNDADGYLIKASTATPTAPIDGIDESTSTLVLKAGALATSVTFNGLASSTTYRFNVYPFEGSGASINYKTDGTVPTIQLTTLAPAPPAIPITTVAEARTKKVGDSVAFRAVVSAGKVGTRNDIFGSYFRARYVQDNTAGIVIDATASGANRTKLTNLQRGDSVLIRGKLNKFDSLLQVQPFTHEDVFFITVISTGNPEPQPLRVTSLDEFNLANEGRLIQIDSVLITDTRTVFQGGGSVGNFIIEKPSVNATLKSSVLRLGDALHELVGRPVPRPMVSLVGVLGNFRGTFQLQPRVPEDLVILTNTITQPSIFLSVSLTGFTFENVNAGSVSASQRFGVTAYKLTDSVRINVPLGFEIDTSSTFGNPISGNQILVLPMKSDSTLAATIYVRFRPTSSGGTTFSGNVVLSSSGAETVRLPLLGQEGPKIILSATSLSDFGIVRFGNSSAFRSYTVSAQALTDSVRIQAGTHFEISQDSLGTYTKSLALAPTDFATAQRVYVRFKPDALINANGNPVRLSSIVSHTSQNAATQLLSVSGSEGNPPTALFFENFDTTCFPNANMIAFSAVGTEAWRCRLETGRGGFDETTGAQMSGFNGVANVLNEDWLITRNISLPNAETFLSFYLRKEFTGRDLRVLISDNYTFGNSPKTATWDTLPSNLVSGQSSTWREYRNISLDAYRNKNISIAFYYTSDNAGASRTTIDIVRVTTIRVTDPSEITASLTSLRQSKYENEGVSTISIRTSRALPFEQKVYVSVRRSLNAIYGTDYTTTPAELNNELLFTIPANATTASFSVNLIDDSIEEDYDTLYFSIRAIDGGARIKPDSALHTFIIVDNEVRTGLTISDLRQNTPEGISRYNLFLVSGIVGTVHGINYGANGMLEFRMIDVLTRKGITIKTNVPFSGYTFREGDRIRVDGAVKMINGLTTLEPSAITVIGNNALLSPRNVTALKLDESMESDLITLEKVTIRRIIETSEGRLVTLWNGKNEILMLANKNLAFAASLDGLMNKVLSITGFVTQVDSTSPYDDGYMILPRNASDIQVLTAIDEEQNLEIDFTAELYTKVYPNPATSLLWVELYEASTLQITNVTGDILMKITLEKGVHQLDVSSLPNSIYLVTINRQHFKIAISK